MKRKLASVQYVHNITPIEGADNIECVHVLGWKCVAKKGEFKVGDYCVYSKIVEGPLSMKIINNEYLLKE